MRKGFGELDPNPGSLRKKIYPDPDPGEEHFFKFDEPIRDKKFLNNLYFFNSLFFGFESRSF